MSDGSKIEWTDATVNAINGCSLASPGCTNCYAMRLAGTRMRNHPSRKGLTIDTKAGPVWNGEVRLVESAMLQPLRWQRSRIIFWNAHGDPFHPAVPVEWVDRMIAVMSLTHWHKHLVLTKRADRMRHYFSSADVVARVDRENLKLFAAHCRKSPHVFKMKRPCVNWPLPNVWLGVSVEDQARADERIPDLLNTPAAGRFLSCEPLLGAVDLRWIAEPDEEKDGVIDALLGCNWVDGMGRGAEFRPARPGHQDRVMTRRVCSPVGDILATRKIDGVIVGGESGPGARPMHPDWARSLRDQCASAGVDFHFKQWGDWLGGEIYTETDPDGVTHGGLSRFPDGPKGETFPGKRCHWWGDSDSFTPGPISVNVGKKLAGRQLDGVAHDALPWTSDAA